MGLPGKLGKEQKSNEKILRVVTIACTRVGDRKFDGHYIAAGQRPMWLFLCNGLQ